MLGFPGGGKPRRAAARRSRAQPLEACAEGSNELGS